MKKFPSKQAHPPASKEIALAKPTVLTVRAEGMMVVIRAFSHTKDFEPMHEVRVWSDYDPDREQEWFSESQKPDSELLSAVVVVKEQAYSEFSLRRKKPLVIAALAGQR